MPSPVGKWNLHLHKVGRSRKHECSKTSWYTAVVDLGPSENTVDQHQQMTWHPNHHWLWKLYTGPQATWILCLSSLPPDSGTLISKGMQNLLSSENITWTTQQQSSLFVFSPGETLLTLSVVQEWLDTRNATAETMSCIHLCVVVLEALTPAAVHSLWISPTFWMGFVHNPLQGAVIPIACTLFSTNIFSFPSPLY